MHPILSRSFLLILLISHTTIYGQHFYLNSSWHTVSIELNGKVYAIDSGFTKLRTKYPAFDTLRFIGESWKNIPIVCNFKPDSSYSLFYNCCGTNDITQTWKLQANRMRLHADTIDDEADEDLTRQFMMDKPFFRLKIAGGTETDSIYGWYMDHSCFPRFVLVNKEGVKYGLTEKCYYWNNISHFVFFKSREDYSSNTDESGFITDVFPEEFDVLGSIFVRLFDNGNYIITYNLKTQKVKLAYDQRSTE